MICRYCDNLNLLVRPICLHCGEEPPKPPDPEPPAEREPTHQRPPDPRAERQKSIALAAAVASVLVLGGFVAFYRWPGREPVFAAPVTSTSTQDPSDTIDQSSSSDPATEMNEMGTLLRSISAASDTLPRTLGSCSTAPSDIGPLRDLIQSRTGHLQQAKNLETDDIPDGESLKQSLVYMLQTTLDTDEKYLTWAEQIYCTSAANSSTIRSANSTATAAKRSFVSQWNSIAPRYSQLTYKWNDL